MVILTILSLIDQLFDIFSFNIRFVVVGHDIILILASRDSMIFEAPK